MRIAISTTGSTLDAEVEPRFGRCPYFILVDPDTMQFEVLENSSAMAGGGAGISTGQVIAGKGVQVVLTGNCGPNAYQVLSAAGIQVITGVAGKVRDAIQAYKSGQFQATSQSNVAAHSGVGREMGMRRGMGMGCGRGKGMGMGGGMKAGRMPVAGSAPQSVSPQQEIETLKTQSQLLAQQLSEIQHRIEDLEKKR